jgi:hypothetical protein
MKWEEKKRLIRHLPIMLQVLEDKKIRGIVSEFSSLYVELRASLYEDLNNKKIRLSKLLAAQTNIFWVFTKFNITHFTITHIQY